MLPRYYLIICLVLKSKVVSITRKYIIVSLKNILKKDTRSINITLVEVRKRRGQGGFSIFNSIYLSSIYVLLIISL